MIALAGALGAAAAIHSGADASAQNDKPRPALAKQPANQTKSLFDRLGGTYAIAALVDDYVNHLAADPVIMSNPALKASIEKAAANNGIPGLKYQITALVIESTGGPYKYHGRDMKESHKDLGITQVQWDAGVAVLKASMDRFKVPAQEQADLNAVLATTHDDIVVPEPKTR
jgi:hemoglobin